MKGSYLKRQANTDKTNQFIGRAASEDSSPQSLNGSNNYGLHSGHSFGMIQTRLKVRRKNDIYEREAEGMAERVMGPGPLKVTNNRQARGSQYSLGETGQNNLDPNIEGRIENTRGSGFRLPTETRNFMERRFGTDFNDVIIHNDPQSVVLNNMLNARAFTIGRDVYFNSGQFNPHQPEGKKLLAHELTHVIQQDGKNRTSADQNNADLSRLDNKQIQGSFFGDLWEGIKSVGKAIGDALTTAVEWIGDRLHDAATWVVNLFRDLPQRLIRFGETILEGLQGIVSFIPEAINALATGGIKGFGNWLWEKAKAGGFWVLRLMSRVFDLVGGPEILEFVTHMLTKTSPLTSGEINTAKSVLGPNAIRWNDVRIAEGGLLSIIFYFNKNRSFVTFHTVNIHDRTDVPVLIHELVHVYQYEKVGSLYLGQAILGQIETPDYNYGGPDGLINAKNSGKHFKEFNREQQAKIVEDYYRLMASNQDTSAYDYFINEMRAGKI